MIQTNDPLLRALARVSQEHKTAEKYLILPSIGQGVATLERLARQGVPTLNLHAVTPVDHAAALLETHGEKPLCRMPSGVGPALLSCLLAGEASGKGVFAALAGSPGVGEALWSSIRDLRLAGLGAKDLSPKQFLSEERGRMLAKCFTAYERELRDRGWSDDAAVLVDAAKIAAKLPRPDKTIYIVPEEIEWTVLERGLLATLKAEKIPVNLYWKQGTPDSPRLAWIGKPAQAPKSKERYEAFHAVSQDAEAREVLRRIASSGLPFDQVEIACAGGDFDRGLLCDLLSRLKIPHTIAEGHPLASTKPGKALLGYLRWVQSGFQVGILSRLMRSGALDIRGVDENLGGNEAARVLASFSGYSGLEAYAKAIDARAAEAKVKMAELRKEGDLEGAAGIEVRAKRLDLLRKVIEPLLKGAAWAADPKKVSMARAVEACRDFLEIYSSKVSELDGSASAALSEALNGLASVSGAMTLADAVAFLRETALSLRVGVERARPGRLHVTSLESLGVEGRAAAFVTGLSQQAYPGKFFQDPFLLDEERKKLSEGLRTSGCRLADRRRTVLGRLGATDGSATFSTYTYDSAEGREIGAAGLFLQAVRLVKGEPELTYRDLEKALGAPAGVPASGKAAAVDGLSWWLQEGVTGDLVERVFPAMAAGRQAVEARAGKTFTEFDGHVSSGKKKLDPCESGEPVSAGYMGELAACPFRFFLKRGLHLHSKAEDERDPLVWLTPMERGALLHEVYALFLRSLRDKKETPEPGKHSSRILSILDERIKEYRELIPPQSEGIFKHEADALARDIELFLRKVSEEWSQRSPVGLEVSFGMDTEGEPLAVKKPIKVEFDGNEFNIHGRVDRVDKVGEHEYEVVDYKTGRYKDEYEEVDLPKEIQPMFYLKAVERLLRPMDAKAQVTAFSFLYSAVKGCWERVRRDRALVERVSAMIPTLLSLLEKGLFFQTWDKDECGRCDYACVCGDEPFKRTKRLMEEDVQLKPAVALKEHAKG